MGENIRTMKRRDTDKDLFSVIHLLDRLARATGRNLSEETLPGDLLSRISEALAAHRKNPMRLNGPTWVNESATGEAPVADSFTHSPILKKDKCVADRL